MKSNFEKVFFFKAVKKNSLIRNIGGFMKKLIILFISMALAGAVYADGTDCNKAAKDAFETDKAACQDKKGPDKKECMKAANEKKQKAHAECKKAKQDARKAKAECLDKAKTDRDAGKKDCESKKGDEKKNCNKDNHSKFEEAKKACK